jgi:hypothetical protein
MVWLCMWLYDAAPATRGPRGSYYVDLVHVGFTCLARGYHVDVTCLARGCHVVITWASRGCHAGNGIYMCYCYTCYMVIHVLHTWLYGYTRGYTCGYTRGYVVILVVICYTLSDL